MACTVLLCSYRCNIFCSIYISDFTHEWLALSSYAILTSFLTHIRRVTKVRQKQQELFILLFGHFLSSLSFPHRSILPFYSPFLFLFFFLHRVLAGWDRDGLSSKSKPKWKQWEYMDVIKSGCLQTTLSWTDREQHLLTFPGKLTVWSYS